MFAIYTFGPQIVGLLGLGAGKSAALGNVVISLCFMLGCIPPMFWLNSAGRRPLLIGSFIMMTLALAVLGLIPDMGAWLVRRNFADWPAGVHRFRPGNARSDAGANQSNDDSQ